MYLCVKLHYYCTPRTLYNGFHDDVYNYNMLSKNNKKKIEEEKTVKFKTFCILNSMNSRNPLRSASKD